MPSRHPPVHSGGAGKDDSSRSVFGFAMFHRRVLGINCEEQCLVFVMRPDRVSSEYRTYMGMV